MIRTEIDLPDGDVYLDDFRAYGTDHFLGYALADHWSVGVQSQVRTHRRLNQEVRAQISPALEYSFFPYEEATRRALTVLYQIGPSFQRYNEETIYGETSEVRWKQLMEVELSQRQPWGNTSVTLSGSSYLHDSELRRLSVSGSAALRVARGAGGTQRRTHRLGPGPDLPFRQGPHRSRGPPQHQGAGPEFQLHPGDHPRRQLRLDLQQRRQQQVAAGAPLLQLSRANAPASCSAGSRRAPGA